MLFSLSLKTLPGGSNRMTDHDAILPVARAPTSRARSKNSRKYPSPSYLTAARAVWLHNKNFIVWSVRSPAQKKL